MNNNNNNGDAGTMITPQLLTALLSAGSDDRLEAEQHLQTLSTEDVVKGLVYFLMQQNDNTTATIHLQQLAAVLLRRYIGRLSTTNNTTLLLQELVDPLTTLFLTPTAPRRSLGHVLAELCATLSLLETTTNVAVPAILDRIAPSCLQGDALSLHCLASICEMASASVCQSGALQKLPALFRSATLSNEAGVEAMVEAICMAAMASQEERGQYVASTSEEITVDPQSFAAQLGASTLVPLFVQMMQCQNADCLTRCFQHLTQAASTCPSLLAGTATVLEHVVQLCLSTPVEETRLSALEVLSSLCLVRHVPRHSPQLRATLVQQAIPQCAQLMVQYVMADDGIEEWAQEPATLLEDSMMEEEHVAHAEALMYTFLHALGTLPLDLVESLLRPDNHDWRQLRAGLSMLEQCLSAAPITFRPHIPVALEAALAAVSSSNNNNVRVQYQALVLLGALCEANVKDPRILEAASQWVASPCSKLSAIASAVIVSYCRGGSSNDDETDVTPYLRDVLQALVAGPLSVTTAVSATSVDAGALVAQVKAIGAVACLAEASGEEFMPFYSHVMPGLFGLVQTSLLHTNPLVARLRGAALEAMTIVGQAVGCDCPQYVADAERILQIALTVLQDENNHAIPMDQLLSACARIASVMGEQYAPFVHQVLPHLLHHVTEQVDITYEEGSEAGLEATKRGAIETDEDGNETMTLSLPGKGLTKVSINMAKMEEKAQACRAIYEHASALGASFGPHAEATLAALVPLISYSYSPEVRSTASQAAAAVFDCACQAGMSVAQDYLPVMSSAMCHQIDAEGTADMEVLYALCEALSDTLYFAYRTMTADDRSIVAKFTTSNGSEIVPQLMKLIAACLKRRGDIFQTLQGAHGALSGQDEENEWMQALEREQEILTPLVDSVGYTLKFLRQDFVPLFDAHVAPVLGSFLQVSPDARARFAATALFDDCVEHCGPAAAQKYGLALAAGVLLGIGNGADEDVQQVSLYGISQIARKCPPTTLEPHAQELISTLLPLANASKQDGNNSAVIENAVSALASLTLIGTCPPLGHLKFLDRPALLATFLKQLPLLEDEDEARICHGGFCDLVQVGQIQPTKEAANILRIIGEIHDAPDYLEKQFASILFRMQREIPPVVMDQAYATLTQEAQETVNGILHQYNSPNAHVVTP